MRRSGYHSGHLGARQHFRGMRDHQLIPHRCHDHSQHDHHVQIRIRIPRGEGAILASLQCLLRQRGGRVEVEPPERSGPQERDPEGGHPGRVEIQVRQRRSRQHDRFAQRDDHEELEALREVARLELPRARDPPWVARGPERSRVAPRSRARARSATARPDRSLRSPHRPARGPRRPRTTAGCARPAYVPASPPVRRRRPERRCGRPGWPRTRRRRAAPGPRRHRGSRRPSRGWPASPRSAPAAPPTTRDRARSWPRSCSSTTTTPRAGPAATAPRPPSSGLRAAGGRPA